MNVPKWMQTLADELAEAAVGTPEAAEALIALGDVLLPLERVPGIGPVLEVGSPGQTTFTVQVDKPLASGVTSVLNIAAITDDGSNHDDTQPRLENSNSVTTQIDATPGLEILFVAPPEQVAPGGVATYRVAYTNEGVQNAQSVVFTITLPAGVTLDQDRSQSGPWSCVPLSNPPGTRCSTDLGEVAVGAPGQGEVHFVVEVDDDMSFPNGVPEVVITVTTEKARKLTGRPQKLPRFMARSSDTKREKSPKLITTAAK